jgi:rhomboid protease GluP
MCPHCRAFITVNDRTCPYCNERVGPRAIDVRAPSPILGGLISHARFNTVIILLINFGLFVATVLFSFRAGDSDAVMGVDGRTLIAFGAMYTPAIMAGQWWRLVTAGFLHGGLLHIFFNSWVLFDLGAQVEEVYGASRMLVIYFVSTVFGFYVSSRFGFLSVGASAALMGLIGAMIALGTRHGTEMGRAMRGQYIRWAVYVIIIGLLPGLRIDNAAHIGGLAAGFGIGYLAGTPRYEGSSTERFWRVGAYVCIVLTAVSFLEMFEAFTHSVQ